MKSFHSSSGATIVFRWNRFQRAIAAQIISTFEPWKETQMKAETNHPQLSSILFNFFYHFSRNNPRKFRVSPPPLPLPPPEKKLKKHDPKTDSKNRNQGSGRCALFQSYRQGHLPARTVSEAFPNSDAFTGSDRGQPDGLALRLSADAAGWCHCVAP